MVKDIDYSHKKKTSNSLEKKKQRARLFLYKKKGEKGFISRVNHKYK